MDTQSTIINIDEIRDVFKEYCEEKDQKFTEKKFEKFLNFLEIDFYDWIRENLNQYLQHTNLAPTSQTV